MELQTAARYRPDELRGPDPYQHDALLPGWDVVFPLGVAQKWYTGRPGFVRQQSICWVFIPLQASACRWGIIRSGGDVVFGKRWVKVPSPCSFCPRTWCGSGC